MPAGLRPRLTGEWSPSQSLGCPMQGLVQEEAAESWAATIKKPLLGPELLASVDSSSWDFVTKAVAVVFFYSFFPK